MKESLFKIIKAIGYVTFSVFIFLSLISYDACDTALRCSQVNSPVKNLTGIIGAHASEGLLLCFGWAAYVLCFWR